MKLVSLMFEIIGQNLLLYAIFVSPIFDIELLTCFAGENYGLVWNRDKQALENKMQAKMVKN